MGEGESFDHVIVGAGTAGCLIANRLTKSGKHKVLLIEAGGSDRRFMIRMPIGYGLSFYNSRINWRYETGPQAALGAPCYRGAEQVIRGLGQMAAAFQESGL